MLVSGVLLTEKYILTIAFPLIDYIYWDRSFSNLIAGVGLSEFDPEVLEHNYPVIKVKDDRSESDRYLRLAIVTVDVSIFAKNLKKGKIENYFLFIFYRFIFS